MIECPIALFRVRVYNQRQTMDGYDRREEVR